MKNFLSIFRGFAWKDNKSPIADFRHYETSFPTNQNAINAVPGWSTSLPEGYATDADKLHTYSDERILWAAECFGELRGANVLELGPLEAGHTIQLEQLGATVTGVEANKLAFLRCLVAKEIVGLKNARFMLGDFVKWLEDCEQDYDLIIASGVLYHLGNPLNFIELAAKRTNALYIWTHFVHEGMMPIGDPRRGVIENEPKLVDFHGIPVRLYRRTYATAPKNDNFNGGMADAHSWMHRDDILEALKAVGLSDIRIAQENGQHLNGPCFSVFASRPRRTA